VRGSLCRGTPSRGWLWAIKGGSVSRQRKVSSEPEPGRRPVSYTDLLDDAEVPDSSIGSEAGALAVPPGFIRSPSRRAGARPRARSSALRPAAAELPGRFPVLARRSDFWRMRLSLWVADATIAAVGALAALLLVGPVYTAIPAVWLLMTAVRATRDGRIADLNDLAPFAKASANFVLLMTLAGIVLSDTLPYARAVLAISLAVASAGFADRWLLGRPYTRRALGIDIGETVVIVGDLASVSRTITEWSDIELLRVVGVCLSQSDYGPEEVNGVPVLGSVADVAALSRRMHIDVVAAHDVDKLGGRQLAKLQWALEDAGTQLSVITPITNTVVGRARVRKLGRRVMVDVAYSRPSGLVAGLKSLVDRLVAAVLLVVALPLLTVCAVAVKATSPGPVIFRQTRVREHGREFTIYKLRTMTVDAEDRMAEVADRNEVGGGLFKMRDDPRVTSTGRWLRRFSLDELPQLWNVVAGDMSLIGPRPALPHQVASYDESARRRLAVKPGLTGLWQVSGRSNLSWDESVRMDSDYVDNWHLARDVSIALRTVKAVLTRDGAH
jgi:exopolysaccharide biosynthesis polyprenyl glycosylphosphotransferase